MSILKYILEREILLQNLQDLLKLKFEDSIYHTIKRLADINRVAPLEDNFEIWEDLRFPFSRDKQGQIDKPDYDFTNLGLLFPQNNATEIAYMIGQLPHFYKEGSDIYPHIHWSQLADTAVVWKLDYKWYNNDEIIPDLFTTITSDGILYTYISGKLSQISTFPAINGTGKKISSMLKLKFYRDDDITTGNVLADEFDIHLKRDIDGSTEQYVR